MPLHAQIICIGGNVMLALLMLLAAAQGYGGGNFGLGLFLTALAAACGYTVWVLLKFRRYLGQEATAEREVHLAHLKRELEAEQAQNPPGAPFDGPIH
jgi:hypothetical protein